MDNGACHKNNNKSKKIIIFSLVIILAAVFVYIRKSNQAILINEDNAKNTDLDIANLIGTWKTHSKTEPKDNRYYIYDLVFIFKKDGTCNLDGTMRIRYTDNKNGSSVTINQIGKCYLNSSGDKMKMDLNDSRALVLYDDWTDFSLNGESMALSKFNYDKSIN